VSWHRTKRPAQGWNTRTALQNPRPPAAPASLDLTLEQYFAAAAVMGLLSAQIDEPEPEWACEWSLKFGETMAAAARKRQRKGRRR
jgi:hypothetical protein